MAVMGAGFVALFVAITRDAELTRHPLPRAAVRAAFRRFGIGGVVYLALIGLAFVNAIVTLALHGLVAIYYCFDQLAPARGSASD
jgi:hypothetical protein